MSLDMDMQEIHDVFFEESLEGLDAMEAGLLGLSPGRDNDPEIINTIFRAAHSIKGGAATFGFLAISNFTHGVETLLDQVRSGEREVTEELIEVWLASVDAIRDMLATLQGNADIDPMAVADLQKQIDDLLAGEVTAPGASAGGTQAVAPAETGAVTWKIHFAPHEEILKTGNEPSRIFRELAELGELEVSSTLSSGVDFDSMDPEHCYSSWDLELRSEVERAQIEEVFDWVSGQCELTIQAANQDSNASATPVSATVQAESTPAAAADKSAAPAKPETGPAKASGGSSGGKDSGSIRVSIDKIDSLLNLVGELVITQSMLARFGDNDGRGAAPQGLRDGLMVLERHTRELQESAMQIRMLPIGASFSRFKRLVRDISSKLGKKVELKLSGENTELDKTVLEKMSDPLVHLVRNSLDHGIEMPDVRKAAGKDETGTLHLSAYHEGGNIVIQVEDDGAGLDKEKIFAKAVERGIVSANDQLSDDQIHNLIFQAGFSTADAVSDLSGRGVGMDVVRRNITDLGGRIDVQSRPGQGSTLKIRLPLTLAILDGQLVAVGSDVYIFSLLSIVETVLVFPSEVSGLVGKGSVYRLRDEYIPVIRLSDAFKLSSDQPPKTYLEREGELLVVVESDGKKMGLFVDELLDQQQVVIKSLEENYMPVQGLAGATILGDGNVALIIDVPSLVHNMDFNSSAKVDQTDAA